MNQRKNFVPFDETRRCLFLMLLLFASFSVGAQEYAVAFSQPHGFYDSPFEVSISQAGDGQEGGLAIRYTLDGSEPTFLSTLYQGALRVKGNTILRAAAFNGEVRVSPVSTATYLFLDDVLRQSNTPEGYPDTWGEFTDIWGTAEADYEMDPEMTSNAKLAKKIRQGLTAIPTLSVVTDREGLFSHIPDSAQGGIYIYTGTPVGDGIGRGWERHVSMEMFGGDDQNLNLTVDCGIKLHGGHSRLAEKNPKHSFRLMFKSEFGPGKLNYPIFGPDGPEKFDQLILRCMFGNAWQHWDGGNRKRAQYERDTWARTVQSLMGHPASRVRYVHLYLNGMYWGLYNLAERVDDYYCSSNFGGKKSEYDVIKVEEDHAGHTIEPADGTMEKWDEMMVLVNKASSSNAAYFQLTGCNASGEPDNSVEPLLDVDNFIDHILINQYGGNTDWDYHNWYAFRNRESADCGFRFVCWDSELIFGSPTEHNLGYFNNGAPTYILNRLVRNPNFLHRYMDRAYKHLVAPGGWLTPERVVQVWDSLYNVIALPLYAESARWGDYRRDVHPYMSQGKLYTVDDYYLPERQRLLTEYFPFRSEILVEQLKDRGWYSKVEAPQMRLNGQPLGAGVDTLTHADVLTFTNYRSVYFTVDGSQPVSWAASSSGTLQPEARRFANGMNVLDEVDFSTVRTLTVRAIMRGSSSNWSPTVERTFVLDQASGIVPVRCEEMASDDAVYDLQGRRLPDGSPLRKGVYVKNGKKILVR